MIGTIRQSADIPTIIATRLRAARTGLGLSRKRLAELARVSERYLSQLEMGEANVSIGVLIKVADALDLDVRRLLMDADSAASVPASPLLHLVGRMSSREQQEAHDVLVAYLEQRRRSLKGIALLGLRGAGKSTIGQAFAARHGLRFVSVTREIENRAGMSLNDLFNLGGPDAYRSLENEVIADLAAGQDRLLVETSGGIAGNGEALDKILASFKTVWLKAAPEAHLARVAGQGDTRPMQGHPKAIEQLKLLLAAREAEYARAEMVIDTTDKTVEQCVTALERVAGPVVGTR